MFCDNMRDIKYDSNHEQRVSIFVYVYVWALSNIYTYDMQIHDDSTGKLNQFLWFRGISIPIITDT